MTIGVLTGGGDVPGLNPCIKAIAYRAIDQGHDVIGIRRGWGGLLWIDRDDPDELIADLAEVAAVEQAQRRRFKFL